MRQRISLDSLKDCYKKEFKQQPKKESKYDGLNEVRKNVIKCNLKNKLAYCRRSEYV